jgi:hypothetical protein
LHLLYAFFELLKFFEKSLGPLESLEYGSKSVARLARYCVWSWADENQFRVILDSRVLKFDFILSNNPPSPPLEKGDYKIKLFK